MTTALQLRRGTTEQHSTFVGANGEITVDTDKKTLVVNDGVTQGGTPLAREDSLTKFVRHDTAAQGLTGTQQGNVRTNIGLGNVNNTSDVNKPISTATQEALDGKLDKSGGTLTGPLALSGNATTALGAVPKQQVEALINTAVTGLTSAYIGGRGQVFTSTGTFTVPDDVTAVKVRGCSGGGGATGGSTDGGTTSFGSYCSATGGRSNLNGGTGGVAAGGDINLNGGAYATSIVGLCGGSGLFGGFAGTPATGYGNGGIYNTSKGGGGGYFEKYITGLTPGASIAVTIGAGGSAAGLSQGSPGICIVEW